MNKKSIIITAIATAFGSALGSFIYKSVAGDDTMPFNDALVQASSEMNKTLPMTVDEDTRLDTTLPGPGNRFSYIYTLVNYTIDELDTAMLRSNLTPGLLNNYRTNPGMNNFRNNNTELHYIYRDKKGILLIDIAVILK